jgi:biopolymer transport protein ExbB
MGRVRALVRDVEWSGNEIMQYLLTDYRNGGLAGNVIPLPDPVTAPPSPMAAPMPKPPISSSSRS